MKHKKQSRISISSTEKGVQNIQQFDVNESNKYVLGGYFGLGLNNFYKTILSIFVKAGIKVKSKNGNIIYNEEKIGEVLRTLYKSTLPDPQYKDSEKAWVSSFDKLTTNQQVQIQKLLFHHFPMLGPIMADETAYKVKNSTSPNDSKKSNDSKKDLSEVIHGVTLTECLLVMSNIAQGLVDCRNANTHFKPYNDQESTDAQNEIQKRLVRYLNKVFVAARRLNKERNTIPSEKLDFLTGYSPKGDEKAYVKKYGFYPKNIQEPKTDEDGKIKYNKNGRPQTKMVECEKFFYRIGCEREKALLLSGFGLVYFCAMFLSKGQTRQMLSDSKLFEVSPYSEEQNGIVRDIINVYRIRTPRGKKLEGSDAKVTLALDILNELRKCPRELFDVLPRDGQKFFEDKIEDKGESVNEHTTDDVVKRIRSNDRFPHLAMKYIDETELFKNIRFQVQLGRFRFKFYDKTCIDRKTEVRALQKEINGFGRLQEIEQKRKEKYQELLQSSETHSVKIESEDGSLNLLQFNADTADSTPYITDSRAFYNICNNRIGLYWEEGQSADGHTFIKKGDYIPDLDVAEGKALVKMPAPRAMLSIYELPAMLFCQYLLSEKKIDKIKLEDLIIGKFSNLRQFFSDVSNGSFTPTSDTASLKEKLKSYHLAINEIPEKLVEYLSSKETEKQAKRNGTLLKGRLALRLQKAIRRKERFEADRKKVGSQENKYAKKAYADIRHGVLARYLSASFLEWQPTKNEGKDKLTGLNFSKLQSALATFNTSSQFDHIKQMLKDANLLGGNIAHPFLQRVLDKGIANVEDLYLKYLIAEINYLKSFFSNISGSDKNIDFDKIALKPNVTISSIPFVRGKARWEDRTDDYYQKLAQRYLQVDNKEAAIWLPDGIFTGTIIDLLKNHYSDNQAFMECLTNDELNNNVAYLINRFFEIVLADHSQPFYISEKKDGTPNKFAHSYDLFKILKNEKVRNALVPVPMTSKQINQRFAKQSIKEEIEAYVRKMTIGKPNPQKPEWQIRKEMKALEEAKTAMRRKLTRAISDVKANERAVRRYKTQDVILFLMAKQLIGKAVEMKNVKDSKEFRLASICNSQFLAQTVDFEFPVDVNGQPVYICQHDMSLKNYGEFYRLLSDDRLPSLLEKLATAKKMEEGKSTLNYTDVMGELASYDIHRSRIFQAVHQLEKMVVSYKDFKIFLNNPVDKRFFIDEDKNKMAKRNNFRSLLELLDGGDVNVLAEKERELIISIRNAFSHNHYKVDLDSIASKDKLAKTTLIHEGAGSGEKDTAGKLTTIATLIVNRLEELQNQVKLN